MLFNPRVPRASALASAVRSAEPFESLEPRRLMAVTVTTVPYLDGTQLRVTGTDADDQVAIAYNPSLGGMVVADGESTTVYGGLLKSVRVEGLGGNDNVVLDASVTVPAFLHGGAGDDTLVGGSGPDQLYGGGGNNTLDGAGGNDVLVSLGGGTADRVAGGMGRDSFWTDSRRTEVVLDLEREEVLTGSLHRVANLFSRVRNNPETARSALGNVSLHTQNLADPLVTHPQVYYSNFANRPLFSDAGPLMDDVAQGAIGDCWLLAVFSSIAGLNPTRIRESVVDLGDGTYLVQFRRGGSKLFVRVDGDLPVNPYTGGLAYAGFGRQDAIWAAVMEKAYVTLRSPMNSYAALDGGWMKETYSAFGLKSRTYVGAPSGSLLLSVLKLELAAGKSVTFGTVPNPGGGAPLLGGHAYIVVDIVYNGLGQAMGARLRNPWGEDGPVANDGNNADGYVIVTGDQLAASFLGMVTSAR